MNFDLIIKRGRIIDGTGNPYYYGDIGIKDGKIVKILSNLNISGVKEIDATNQIVCPGFIDMHSHSDFAIPLSQKLESMINQGITTNVVGMCGQSLAPITDEKMEYFEDSFKEFAPKGFSFNIT